MGGHTPNYFSNAFATPELQGLQYNTSVAGTVITIVFGTTRLSSNLLQYQDFMQVSNGKKGSGKGGGSGKKSGATTYTINLAVGICQGPVSFNGSTRGIDGNNLIWADGGVAAGLAAIGMNGYVGNDGQAVDPVLAASAENQPAIAYSGLCYATATPITLQGSPVLPVVDWEITGFEVGTAGPSFPNDASPANIIVRMLTDPRWGAGFPAQNIDSAGSFVSFAAFCQASSIAMSMSLDRQQPASQWLEQIAEMCVSAVCWSGTLLRIVPFNVTPLNAQGAVFAPSLTPAYTLTDDDFLLPQGETDLKLDEIGLNPPDPIINHRSDQAQIPNYMAMEYKNGDNAYNTDVVPVFDQGNIDQYGLRSQPSKTSDCFTNPTSALNSAQLQLQDKLYVRSEPIKFTLGPKHELIDLMDIVNINDSTLGFFGKLAWVVGIDEGEEGELEITCREIQTQNGTVPVQLRQHSAGAPLALYATPPDVNAPVFIEPTASLLLAYGLTSPALMIALSGGPNQTWSPNWGGAQVFVSTDGTTYGYFRTILGTSPMGFLSNSLSSYGGTNPDTGHTLNVDLSESNAQLTSVSSGAASSGQSLWAIVDLDGNFEFGSFETATMTGPNSYDLTTLYRGLYGTTGLASPSGSQFVYLGTNRVEMTTLPAQYVGQPIFFKFLSFNAFGFELQSLADVVAYEYTPHGSNTNGLFPTGVRSMIPVPIESEGQATVMISTPVPIEAEMSLQTLTPVPIENSP